MSKSDRRRDELTAREFDISSILHRNTETIISYRKNLLIKFKVRNYAELVYTVTKLDYFVNLAKL